MDRGEWKRPREVPERRTGDGSVTACFDLMADPLAVCRGIYQHMLGGSCVPSGGQTVTGRDNQAHEGRHTRDAMR